VAFLGLGGVGETPETRWSRPSVTAACWPDGRCAVREKDGVGGGGKGLTREPWLAIRPGKVSRKALLYELKAQSLAALPLPFFVRSF